MAFFAVIGLDHPPHAMDRRDAVRPAHRAYVRGNDAMIALAGAMVDDAGNQCGSLYIFEADSEDQVREWLAGDAFVQGGVYREIVVRRIGVARNRIAASDWPAPT